MQKEVLIIDTDPGIDDAAALAIALFSEKLDVKLITTVAGNVSIDKVTNNALRLLTFWNKKIPVARGAEKPLLAEFIDAADIHGESGMDGYEFPQPDMSLLVKEHAVIKMHQVIMEQAEPLTLVPIGPLTNIALLLSLYPEVRQKIKRIVLMGGSFTRGNKTVMGEFNIATDPEAAKIVFSAGIPLVMAGLEVGLKALVRSEDSKKLLQMGKTAQMLHAIFQKYRSGSFATGVRMFDACAIAYILQPEMFEITEAFVDIELSGRLTSGCSVVDFKGLLKQPPNTQVCTDIDGETFRTWFMQSLGKCP